MPGGAFGREPDLARRAVRIEHVPSSVGKFDRQDIARELSFDFIAGNGVEARDQSLKLRLSQRVVVGLGEGGGCHVSVGPTGVLVDRWARCKPCPECNRCSFDRARHICRRQRYNGESGTADRSDTAKPMALAAKAQREARRWA